MYFKFGSRIYFGILRLNFNKNLNTRFNCVNRSNNLLIVSLIKWKSFFLLGKIKWHQPNDPYHAFGWVKDLLTQGG